MSIFVDLHIIQTVPPSCVNRDDTGSPKTAVYGGVTRARVSSQAWKHAMRDDFWKLFDEYDIGSRTKDVVYLVVEEMSKSSKESEDKLTKKAAKVLEAAGIKLDEKNGDPQAKALFFISAAQIEAAAELALKGVTDKKSCTAALAAAPSVDIALFGRMLASNPELNQDAAAQVAHAISTHAVHNEYDYFTAVDDCQTEDNAGAGHLGTTEFNSSTLYRYATVNASELYRYLGNDTASAVRKFALTFIRTMPTGKIKTFANNTLPDHVYITVRSDQPVNLCGAFEKPVIKDSEGGYSERSIKRLSEYADDLYEMYDIHPDAEYTLDKTLPLPKLLEKLEKDLNKKLKKSGDK